MNKSGDLKKRTSIPFSGAILSKEIKKPESNSRVFKTSKKRANRRKEKICIFGGISEDGIQSCFCSVF